MTDQIYLYVIELDHKHAQRLKKELNTLSTVSVSCSYAEALTASHGFDALLVPLMSALEWGVIPVPTPLYQTRVVKSPASEIAKGRPQYVIPGIATSPGESMSPSDATRLVLRESFKAIYRFNRSNPSPLKAIGASALSLGLDKLESGEAATLLRDAYMSLAA